MSSSQEIVFAGYQALQLGEQRLEKLRKDREVHSYKQIWTKDPHDGPYRKAAVKEHDPLLHFLDGTERKVELGYERVERGPTSNFVGNHMTQGAIDLVQAELTRSSSSPLLLRGRSLPPKQLPIPKLLYVINPSLSSSAQLAPPPATSLQQYSWWDTGKEICIQLSVAHCMELLTGAEVVTAPLPPHPAAPSVPCTPTSPSTGTPQGEAGGGSAAVQECSVLSGAGTVPLSVLCIVGDRSLLLELRASKRVGGCEGGVQGQGCCTISSSQNAPPSSPHGIVQLKLQPLCHSVLPSLCALTSTAAPCNVSPAIHPSSPSDALPPAASPLCAAAGEGHVGEGLTVGKGITSGDVLLCAPCHMHMSLWSGDGTVCVRLHKVDPDIQWESLAGTGGSQHGQSGEALSGQQVQQLPDLTVLRRAVRQQRQVAGRPSAGVLPLSLPTSAPPLHSGSQAQPPHLRSGTMMAPLVVTKQGREGTAAGIAVGPYANAVTTSQNALKREGAAVAYSEHWKDHLGTAQRSALAGQYQAALELCTAFLLEYAPPCSQGTTTEDLQDVRAGDAAEGSRRGGASGKRGGEVCLAAQAWEGMQGHEIGEAGGTGGSVDGPQVEASMTIGAGSEEPLLSSSTAAVLLTEALSLRARCHCQLGGLKQALVDYSSALELASTATMDKELPQELSHEALLRARAAVHEQLEQYGAALADLRLAASVQLQGGHQPTSQVALSIARVERSLRASERMQGRLP